MSEYTIELRPLENYISMPVIPTPSDPDSVFGRDVEVWEYKDGKWARPSSLECSKGYYVYNPWKTREITISGTDCTVTFDDLLTIYRSLKHGEWALVGPGTEPISVEGTGLEWHVQGYNYDESRFIYTNTLEPAKAYWLERPLGCYAPTPHFESGYAMLEYFDTDNDGYLTSSDLGKADEMFHQGKLTEEEFNFISSLFAYPSSDPRYGSINAKCPGEILCDNNPYGSLALETGCELMLYYDKNNDGVIDRDELDICYKDWVNGKITEPEFDYVGEAYYRKSINKLCPGCYKGKKKLTFIAKDEHGTEITGVEIRVDGALKGMT